MERLGRQIGKVGKVGEVGKAGKVNWESWKGWKGGTQVGWVNGALWGYSEAIPNGKPFRNVGLLRKESHSDIKAVPKATI